MQLWAPFFASSPSIHNLPASVAPLVGAWQQGQGAEGWLPMVASREPGVGALEARLNADRDDHSSEEASS